MFIKVYDKNLTRDHLMGEAMLDTEALDLSSSCEVVLALQAGLDDKLTKRAELQQCGLGRVVVRLSRAADQTEVGPAECVTALHSTTLQTDSAVKCLIENMVNSPKKSSLNLGQQPTGTVHIVLGWFGRHQFCIALKHFLYS